MQFKRKKAMTKVLRRKRIIYIQGHRLAVVKLKQITIEVAGEKIVLINMGVSDAIQGLRENKTQLMLSICRQSDYTQLVLDKRNITAIEGIYERQGIVVHKRYNYRPGV